jgi:hypothetical protein
VPPTWRTRSSFLYVADYSPTFLTQHFISPFAISTTPYVGYVSRIRVRSAYCAGIHQRHIPRVLQQRLVRVPEQHEVGGDGLALPLNECSPIFTPNKCPCVIYTRFPSNVSSSSTGAPGA